MKMPKPHANLQIMSNIYQITLELITKTCLYNFFDPLKPHFYIVKLGFTGVYIIFLIFAGNIDCGYSLEPPHNLCFEQKYEKYHFFFFYLEISVFGGEIVYMFE